MTAPTIAAIAADIATIFLTALADPFVEYIIIETIEDNNPTANMPLANDAVSIILSNTHTPAMIPIAVAIPNKVPASLVLFPAVLAILTIAFIIKANKPIAIIPLVISPGVSMLTSLTTPTIISIDTDIDRIIPLTLAICCPESILTIPISALMNSKNAVAKATPFNISDSDNKPMSLTTPTIIIIEFVTLNNKRLNFAMDDPLSIKAAFFNP